jgi:putative alpha-1,2-mannosidase
VSVPLFDEVKLKLNDHQTFTIVKKNSGAQMADLTCDGRKIDGYFITHQELMKGKKLVITTK